MKTIPSCSPCSTNPFDAEDNQYIGDAILEHHIFCTKWGFLVHWQGYSDVEESWVKEAVIDPEIVKVCFKEL